MNKNLSKFFNENIEKISKIEGVDTARLSGLGIEIIYTYCWCIEMFLQTSEEEKERIEKSVYEEIYKLFGFYPKRKKGQLIVTEENIKNEKNI